MYFQSTTAKNIIIIILAIFHVITIVSALVDTVSYHLIVLTFIAGLALVITHLRMRKELVDLIEFNAAKKSQFEKVF